MDIFGAIGDLFGGFSAASGEYDAAHSYDKAAAITKQATGLKELAAGRQIFQTLGAARADIGASGIKLSGSAADLMRASAAQGSITKSLIQEQGQIDQSAYEAQAAAARAQAKSDQVGGIMGFLGGLF